MNILVPHSWLMDFLKTDVDFNEIARLLTLHGPTVESTKKTDSDVIYDIEVTPNRSDLFSITGIARETTAILNYHGKNAEYLPLTVASTNQSPHDNHQLFIETQEQNLVLNLMAVVMDKAKIGSSPEFIKDRLEKSGLRAINNVVDISNYVMLETGHPLHVFDYDLISGHTLTFRQSRQGEEITPLDGEKRTIPENSLVIEDANQLIDLCGIMGGENSGIRPETERIVVFVPIYNPILIRKAFRALNMPTPAALRYEKGIDKQLTKIAFARAIELLEKHAGAQIASDITSWQEEEKEASIINVPLAQIDQALGDKITIHQAANALTLLGFSVDIEDGFSAPVIKIKVPSYRVGDVSAPEDVIEEVVRLYGYHNLKSTIPKGEIPLDDLENIFQSERNVKQILVSRGLFEIYSGSIVNNSICELLGFSEHNMVSVQNPLKDEARVLRPSLLPNLLQAVTANQSREEVIPLFEMERIYSPTENLPDEKQMITALIASANSAASFYTLRIIFEELFASLNVDFEFVRNASPADYFVKGTTVTFRSNNEEIATIGVIGANILDKMSIKTKVAAIIVDLDILNKHSKVHRTIPQIVEHPPVIEDLSFFVDHEVDSGGILTLAQQTATKTLKLSTVKLADIFMDDENNRKSISLRINYQSESSTPDNSAIIETRRLIIDAITNKYSATLRGQL